VRTCERYARAAELTAYVDVGDEAAVLGTSAEQSLGEFAAAREYADVLVGAGVDVDADIADMFADVRRLESVEQQLRAVPGNGGSDIRLGYLWTLVGDNSVIQPDRMVLG